MVQRRPVLEVSWPDDSRPPVSGMFVGAAGFTRATNLSVRVVREGGIEEGAGVAATLVSVMAQVFGGAERDQWLRGDPMSVAPLGGAAEARDRFMFIATTLNRLVLGLWPFWGEGEGVRFLDVDARPRRLASALPAVLRGRPRPWMAEAGYRSGVAPGLDLTLHHPFVIDGELFEAGPGGRVRLSAGQTLDFVTP
jgi:hypothetical protein